jgi:Flp pilus assembly protein TadG
VGGNDRGAAAVEFALVVPLLIALIAGIAEFGQVYHRQTTLSGSAREAVRILALKNDPVAARAAARSVAAPLVLTDGQIAIVACPSTAGSSANAVVTITYPMPILSGAVGTTVRLTGKGVMRCGG